MPTDNLAGVLVDKRPAIELVISKCWSSINQCMYVVETWSCVGQPLADCLLKINEIIGDHHSYECNLSSCKKEVFLKKSRLETIGTHYLYNTGVVSCIYVGYKEDQLLGMTLDYSENLLCSKCYSAKVNA